jgi:methionyl-tRNA formyltransferase
MNITLLVNKDIASNYALNCLLPWLKQHNVSVFLSANVGGNKPKSSLLSELKFFEQQLFNDIIFPLLDNKVTHEHNDDQLLSFEQLSHRFHIPILEIANINQPEGFALFKQSAPDLVVCIRFGFILKEEVLAVAKFGTINLHSSILPDYKGVMATFRAMMANEPFIGTTLHFIQDASIDTGDIIGQTRFEVLPSKSYLWHVINLYSDAAKLIADTVKRIDNKEVLSRRAQVESGQYYSFPMDDEISMFYQQSLKLFDSEEMLSFAKRFQ